MTRPLPPLVFLLSLGSMLTLHLTWPLVEVVPRPFNLAGAVVVLLGLTLTLWGARLFTRVGTNIRTFDEPGTLVVHGPYRYTRNPMYAGFVLALIGVGLLLGSATPWMVVLAFYLLCERWYIRFEEARLLAKFGAEYDAYRRRVRRWL